MALGDGTKCKTFFWGPRMIQHAHWKKYFSKIEVWLLTTLRDPKGYSSEEKNYWLGILTLLLSGLICISSLAPTPVPLYSLQITSLWKKNHSSSMQFPRCTELTTSRLHFPGMFSLRRLCQSFASYFHILFLPRCVWSRPSIPVMRRLMPIINLFILSQFSEQQPSNNSTACSTLYKQLDCKGGGQIFLTTFWSEHK